jgi:hypothetical protein
MILYANSDIWRRFSCNCGRAWNERTIKEKTHATCYSTAFDSQCRKERNAKVRVQRFEEQAKQSLPNGQLVAITISNPYRGEMCAADVTDAFDGRFSSKRDSRELRRLSCVCVFSADCFCSELEQRGFSDLLSPWFVHKG